MPITGKLYAWEKRAKNIPEEAGVYALYNQNKTLIYIGGTPNLRKTFTHYLNTNFSDDPRKQETKYYKRETTPNWQEKTKQLLDEYNQEHGEPPKLNTPTEPPKKEATPQWGFYFYQDINKPTFEAAFNLQEFWKKIKTIPTASLEFHQKRGDFAKWIRDVFKETQLAQRIEKINTTGEDLRKDLLNAPQNQETAECPKCKTQTNPHKTWTMPRKPSKTGEKLQLTIALYKCNNCKKTFRKVIKKEKIKP